MGKSQLRWKKSSREGTGVGTLELTPWTGVKQWKARPEEDMLGSGSVQRRSR